MKSECYIDTDSGESELHKLVNVLKPNSNNKIVLLMHMNGCGHCHNMQRDWELMVGDLVKNKEETLKRNNAYISRIESGNLQNIPQQYSTSGFPHIVYINNDKIQDTYNGPRVKDEMEKWAISKLVNKPKKHRTKRRTKRRKRKNLPKIQQLFTNRNKENILKDITNSAPSFVEEGVDSKYAASGGYKWRTKSRSKHFDVKKSAKKTAKKSAKKSAKKYAKKSRSKTRTA
tara:strand:- start:48 stop:737 length:690 start_codon:yes stop_codon:yes gene_type:complete